MTTARTKRTKTTVLLCLVVNSRMKGRVVFSVGGRLTGAQFDYVQVLVCEHSSI